MPVRSGTARGHRQAAQQGELAHLRSEVQRGFDSIDGGRYVEVQTGQTEAFIGSLLPGRREETTRSTSLKSVMHGIS